MPFLRSLNKISIVQLCIEKVATKKLTGSHNINPETLRFLVFSVIIVLLWIIKKKKKAYERESMEL